MPVQYDLPRDEMKKVFMSLNGLLFTGGMLTLLPNTTYFQTAQTLWDWAISLNDSGTEISLLH